MVIQAGCFAERNSDNQMVHYIAVLTVKEGKRAEYIEELKKERLVEQFRDQTGNVHYYITESVDDPNVVLVSDQWETKADFDAHCSSEIVKKQWNKLYKEYVTLEKSNLYEK